MPVWQVCVVAAMVLTLAAQAAPAEGAVDWPARFEAKLAELRAQGEPVTMEEIMARRPQIPDDENSALVFLQAFAAEEAVAFDVPPADNAHQGFATVVGARQPEPVLSLVRASVQADAEALGLIHEGARLSRGRYPITLDPNPLATAQPYLSQVRKAGHLCLREAAVRAHEGNGDDAADSLLAVHRLSASLGEGLFLFTAFVQMALDRLFCDGLEWTLGLCELPPDKLDAISHELKSEGGARGLAMPLRAERAGVCYLLTHFDEWRKFAEEADIPPNLVERGRTAAQGLEYLDYMRQSIRIAGLPDRGKLYEAARVSDEAMQLPPEEHLVTALLLPSLRRVFEEEVKARTCLRVARVALAVEQWRLKNGAWPESLDALVPELLDAVPQDPFADGPVGYVQTGGGVIVYSVGPNGQYDGGRSPDEAQAAGQPDAYDLTFRLLDADQRGTRQAPLEDESLAGGVTLLHAPAQAGQAALVERLLDRGANVHAWDEKGRTPLHLAAQAGHRDVAELLLKHGADVNSADNQGHTPTGLAAEAGHEELAEFLREHGGVE